MTEPLIRMYEQGALTEYQAMIEALHVLDPNEPDLVLGRLPNEILDEMLAYSQRYDAHGRRSSSGVVPAEGQVRAAEFWIREHRLKPSEPVRR